MKMNILHNASEIEGKRHLILKCTRRRGQLELSFFVMEFRLQLSSFSSSAIAVRSTRICVIYKHHITSHITIIRSQG